MINPSEVTSKNDGIHDQQDQEALVNFWLHALEYISDLYAIDQKNDDLNKKFIDIVKEITRVNWIGLYERDGEQNAYRMTMTNPDTDPLQPSEFALDTKLIKPVMEAPCILVLPLPEESPFRPFADEVLSRLSQSNQLSALVPVFFKDGELTLFILLGKREDSHPYSSNDLRFVSLLTNQFIQAKKNLKLVKEREDQQARLVESLDSELEKLIQIGDKPSSVIAARFHGRSPLKESHPDTFMTLVKQYGNILDLMLEQLAYKVETSFAEDVRQLSSDLGFLRAGPQDVLDLNKFAIQKKSKTAPAVKLKTYLEEGKMLVLRIMGLLVSYYRNYSIGSSED